MLNRKIPAILLVCVLMSALFAACAKPVEPADSPITESPATTPESPADPDAMDPDKLAIMTTDNAPIGCSYGREDGIVAITATDAVVEASWSLSPLSVAAMSDGGAQSAKLVFGTAQPQKVELFLIAGNRDAESVTLTDGVFDLPQEVGGYFYFAHITWAEGDAWTVWFRVDIYQSNE